MNNYTDLCAQGEALSAMIHLGEKVSFGQDTAMIDALIAAIRELEGERDRRTEMPECAMSERDDATLYADEQKARAESAEATVATLTAQMEAMRGADWRCCGCGSPPPFNCQCTTEVAYRANTNGKSETSLKAQVARAALTTENQTNG